jgi:hypothetical protein
MSKEKKPVVTMLIDPSCAPALAGSCVLDDISIDGIFKLLHDGLIDADTLVEVTCREDGSIRALVGARTQ